MGRGTESDWERFNIGNLAIWHVPTKLKKTYRRIKMVTWRQTLEVDGDARRDNETEVKGTQDGRFTENLPTSCLTSVYLYELFIKAL